MKRKYLDLTIAMGITALTAVLVIAFPEWRSPVRIALGLVVVLMAPGYVLTNALFPRRSDIDGIERLALTLGLSIAVVPLLGLILNYTPWGIRLVPIAVTLTLFVLLLGFIARSRRAAAPEEDAYTIPWGTPAFRQGAGLAAVALVALIGVPALAVALRPEERFTEFYVLGEGGKLEGYPTRLAPGEAFTLTFGVGNFEGEPTRYRLVAAFGEDPRTFETPAIPAGERWEETLELAAPDANGRTKLPFELYRDGVDTEAYRNLHLFVDIEPDESHVGASGDSTAQTEPTDPAAGTAWTLHPVQPGETLFGIARQFLGNGNRYPELFDANRDVLDDPTVIPPGTVLRIPVTP